MTRKSRETGAALNTVRKCKLLSRERARAHAKITLVFHARGGEKALPFRARIHQPGFFSPCKTRGRCRFEDRDDLVRCLSLSSSLSILILFCTPLNIFLRISIFCVSSVLCVYVRVQDLQAIINVFIYLFILILTQYFLVFHPSSSIHCYYFVLSFLFVCL